MPDLSTLESVEITIPVMLFGHAVMVTYRPLEILGDAANYTKAIVTENQDVFKTFVTMFTRVVVLWDITETVRKKQVPVPITFKRLTNGFPVQILMTIMEACIYDRDTRNLPRNHPMMPSVSDMAEKITEIMQMASDDDQTEDEG